MKVLNLSAGCECAGTLGIGYRGENDRTEVRFDFSAWAEEFGAPGAVELFVRRQGDTDAYPVALTIDGSEAVWTVSSVDTAAEGLGEAEFVWLLNGVVAKTAVWGTYVAPDIGQPADDPPDPYESWMEALGEMAAGTLINAQRAETAQEGAEAAAESAETARTAAEAAQASAAQSAAEAETSANAAIEAKNEATASATAAAASETNAAQSAETAQTAATTATQKASAASSSASSARSSATSASSYSSTALAAASNAVSASTRALNAQHAAETAQGASEAAQSAAEESAGEATQSSAEAATSAGEAAQSATDAAQSATEAAESATAAAASATAAAASEAAAEDAQEAAEAAQAAAEAVLESIPEDYSEMSGDVSDLKNDVTQIVGGEIIRFQKSKYIDTNPSGGTITPTNPGNNQYYQCAAVACQAGDVFTVTGDTDGSNSHFLLWAFVNSSGKKISNSYADIGSVENNLVITAPSNAVYLVCNSHLANDAFLTKNASPIGQIKELDSKAFKYMGLLKNTDDLNSILNVRSHYRWTSSNRPANSPTTAAAVILCFGASGVYYQLVLNTAGLMWTRAYTSGSWGNWNRLAYNVDLQAAVANITALQTTMAEITEEIETESIATITGEAEDSWENRGITLTKKADNEFTLTGNSSGKIAKGFNILLDGDEVLTNSSTNVTANISEPGIYTLAYKTSGMTFTGPLFGITEGDFKNRRYIYSGESFEVEDDPVCLFVYAATTFKTNTKTLTVKWALYKGEEYRGFPYTDSGEVPSAVDLVARNKGGEKGVDPRYQEYISWGKANALANARHIINIKWTPTAATMPMNSSAYYAQDTEYQGIPYSSVRDDDKFVGINVSLHTFMTAVNDPRSVLYTRRSTTQNANTYYGSVCSTFCDYAYRLGVYLSNDYLGTCDLFEDVPLQDLQIGDLLYRPGHVMMCVDVTKDKYGRIETITVFEEWAPNGRAKYYSSFEKFIDSRPGYGARRYKALNGVPYTPIPYVRCFDEEEQDIVYPDVQTEYGDAAVFPEGADVEIHVLNARDFSSIVVTKGETTVMTVTTIADFTVENAEPGLYTITATGTEYESVSTFFVVDMTCSLNTSTHVLSFASDNALPTSVYVYWLDTKEGKIRPVSKPVILTDADRTAGSIDLSDLMDEDYCNVKITFATDYGTATWYSETHDRWEPVT